MNCFDSIRRRGNADLLLCSRIYEEMLPHRRWDKSVLFLISDREHVKKKCLYAIRRDEGKHFKLTENTKICSQHFRKGYIRNVSRSKLNWEMELSLLCFHGFEHRHAKERSRRKETSSWQLRKVHHENCLPQLLFLKNYQMNRQTNYQTKWSQIYQIYQIVA